MEIRIASVSFIRCDLFSFSFCEIKTFKFCWCNYNTKTHFKSEFCSSSVLPFLSHRRASASDDCGEQEWWSESPFSSCVITRSGCFKHSFNLRWDHVCWFSPFCPQNPHFIIIPLKEETWGDSFFSWRTLSIFVSDYGSVFQNCKGLEKSALNGLIKDSYMCF